MIILTPTYNFPDCIPQPIAIAEGGAVAVDCTINATGLIGELTGVFGATRETHERGIKKINGVNFLFLSSRVSRALCQKLQ